MLICRSNYKQFFKLNYAPRQSYRLKSVRDFKTSFDSFVEQLMKWKLFVDNKDK